MIYNFKSNKVNIFLQLIYKWTMYAFQGGLISLECIKEAIYGHLKWRDKSMLNTDFLLMFSSLHS